MATDQQIFESNINSWSNREPVLLGTAIVQLVVAGIALAATFGLNMTDAQINALWGFLAAFSTILWIGAGAIRNHVYAPSTVAKIEAAK
jgi:cytochrome b subunit of formate dehydrogenase